MNHKKYLLVAAFAFSFIFGQTVFAHSHECGERLQKMVETLQIDDAQKAKIKPVLEQLKSSLKDEGAQMKDLRAQIKQQVQSDTMDQATLDGLIDKKAKLIGDMMKAKSNASHQIYMVLTPEQKTKFQGLVKNMEEKMAEKFKKCHDSD